MPQAAGWTKLTSLPGVEVELLVGRLREAGIRSQVAKATDDPSGWLTAFGSSGGLFDIYVPEDEGDRARQLLVGSDEATTPEPELSSTDPPVLRFGRGLLPLAVGSVIAVLLIDLLR